MENNHCLNCNEPIARNYCANCGQKTATHRITLRHFIAHDLLHGTFHLERGILFTMKEALVRPGRAALDYISGKRIRYYNVFYLSLILIGLAIVLSHIGLDVDAKGSDQQSEEFLEFLSRNLKFFLFGFIPIFAVNARLLFWKMRLNLAEHFIAAGFIFVGVLQIMLLLLAVDAIIETTAAGNIFEILLLVIFVIFLLFPVWAYGNLAWKTHSFLGILWRIPVFYTLVLIESFLLFLLALWLVTGNSELHIN